MVHDLLSSSHHAYSSSRPFDWTVTESPVKTLQEPSPGTSSTKYVVHPSRLAEPATNPPLPQLPIEHPHLPYNIVIVPSPQYGLPYVSVGDVLAELYQMLRLSVAQPELNMLLQHHPRRAEPISEAHHKRVRAATDRRYEESRGVRRVDLLMGQTKFAGLETKPNSYSVTLKLR
jgi:hypothetical protein